MRITDVIAAKRRGEELTDEQIGFWIDGLESFADYQNSALLMAIVINGMSLRETSTLTRAMLQSGSSLDLSRYGDATVDKHSTGGVGDGTSLIVMPVAAACGKIAAKLSGRGLGHTGGTLDKLESVYGVRTDLSQREFFDIIDKTGIAIAGQTDSLCPADKYLYALRDVTATVDSIPLIASSVMSKKLAAGARNIVLDVKTGRGAFLKTREESETLAKIMVGIGSRVGRNVSALVTDMDSPLENCIGNAIEVQCALRILRGEERGEVYDVSKALCAALGVDGGAFDRAIASGAAYAKFESMIAAQGGKPGCLERLPVAKYSVTVEARESGYVADVDALKVARAVLEAGGGRKRKGDPILPEVGARLHVAVGDRAERGMPLATLYFSRPGDEELAALLADAFSIAAQEPPRKSRIICKIDKEDL